MAKIFKALSNEQRLKLFTMICKWSECVDNQCVLNDGIEKTFTRACDCLNLARSTISHHFKELQNAGLITCTRKGKTFSCKINYDIIQEIKDFI